MGAVVKLIDATIFLFLVVIVVGAPLIDSQICLPPSIFPNFLIDLKNRYTSEFGDYFFTNTPHFFVGMVWLQLLFQWSLALLNLYGILGSKSWFKTTCLMYGVSVISTMVPILSELLWSGKASDKMIMAYSPFMGLGVLATLRGLLPHPTTKTTSTDGKKPPLSRKKRV
ncbi:hypothetical protein FEM48_Zijuj04G0089000 [Ziziphus jujuba var. spinosa]|uniref:EXPERA domain-containing protein n=1 Tax=Ziziphus jujuba var. spinosa TaxID=714518 RepID=A0A978VIY3_ZIZJJ|nr:hypothetical protein FEM48_Zijuj04G0089000 [Ziziphus jujuba var. spinosa]